MFNRHVKCFRKCTYDGIITRKKIYQQVQHSLVLKNLTQQHYHIEKFKDIEDAYFKIGDRITSQTHRRRILKKVAKSAAASGMTTDVWIKRARETNKQSIVTGKSHMAKLLGMSESSGGRILRRMHALGIITRTVIMQVLGKVVCQAELDEYIQSCPDGNIQISKKGICRLLLGPKVSLTNIQGTTKS